MQQLQQESTVPQATPGQQAAALLMEVAPLVMRHIRSETRSRRMPGLSVPQFRTMVFLYRTPGVSLSRVAEHTGLSLPSASKMVDTLATRGLVKRAEQADDRRYVSLTLSRTGANVLARARKEAEGALGEKIGVMPPERLDLLLQGLLVLRQAFAPESAEALVKGT